MRSHMRRRMNDMKSTFLIVLILMELLVTTTAFGVPRRSKVIEFDDELVEGINGRPLDHLTEIAEKERRRNRAHLYRSRTGFRQETKQTLREMRYSP